MHFTIMEPSKQNPEQNQLSPSVKKQTSCAVDMFFITIIVIFGIVMAYLVYNLIR